MVFSRLSVRRDRTGFRQRPIFIFFSDTGTDGDFLLKESIDNSYADFRVLCFSRYQDAAVADRVDFGGILLSVRPFQRGNHDKVIRVHLSRCIGRVGRHKSNNVGLLSRHSAIGGHVAHGKGFRRDETFAVQFVDPF